MTKDGTLADGTPPPEVFDPRNRHEVDNLYYVGRKRFEEGKSCLDNEYGGTGEYGRALFAGWLDALADRVRATNCSEEAYRLLLHRGEAHPF